jgi:hypothetical protein
MRYLIIILLTFLLFSCKKKNEFREDPDINHTVEMAVNANVGLYLAAGKVGKRSIDSLDIVVSKIDASTIQITSSQFPPLSVAVNNLTDYSGYASPGGSGLDLVSTTNGIQLSIINSSMLLKYQKNRVTLDLAAKKIQ